MDQLLRTIQENSPYAHWIIFGALLLAGINIPVSEDAMLFMSGWLASENPQYFWHLWWAVFLGAYLSDLMCDWQGFPFGVRNGLFLTAGLGKTQHKRSNASFRVPKDPIEGFFQILGRIYVV